MLASTAGLSAKVSLIIYAILFLINQKHADSGQNLYILLLFFICLPFLYSGYEGLIANLMSELPDDIVKYYRPVRSVYWSNTEKQSSVIVECEDGERINADHVVVTVPLGNFSQAYLSYKRLLLYCLQSHADQFTNPNWK